VAIDRANDRVHLPVADLLAQFDGGRPLADVTLTGQMTASLGASVTFSPFGGLAQEPEQRTAAVFIAPDEAIDRLVTDLEPPFETKPPADLIRTQTFTQELDNEIPIGSVEPAIASRSRATTVRLILGMIRTIDVVAPGAVACELAANRAARTAHKPRDLSDGQRRRLLSKRREHIPLIGGDLVIAHCDTFLLEDFVSVPDRPSSRNTLLHFVCESAGPRSSHI